MKRDIYSKLLDWKISDRRKPLILRGARQTGKTYILDEFGKNEYGNVHYFNFEAKPSLADIFSRDLEPSRIIEQLSMISNKHIRTRTDLIIFDEIQVCNNALNSLKYFYETANEFHIVAAGSLLGVRLSSASSAKSFPVGKVSFLDLYPMTFFEFLDAVDKSKYRKFLEGINNVEPIPLVFHEELLALLRKYYFIGGMPEAVKYYVKNHDLTQVREIQKEILDTYVLDFAKHAPTADTPKLSLVWESIPTQLARENKKFIFSAISKSARARDYEYALQWLEKSGLILRALCVNTAKHPLKGFVKPGVFKVYALDVGLLGAMAGVPVEVLVQGDRLFNDYQGAFVENYVAGQLVASLKMPLYYWKSEGKMAELDFLFPVDFDIYPLEVKAGINARSKSLKSFDRQFAPPLLLRTTLLNLKHDGKSCNIPLYAVSLLRRIIDLATPGVAGTLL
ncbi:MAG: ATP-binding protein [bacterium]|nr:ATP-binding protein [bacterium]